MSNSILSPEGVMASVVSFEPRNVDAGEYVCEWPLGETTQVSR